MAESNGKARPHGRRYPWAEWFARGAVRLVRGVDFDCQPHGMAQAARNAGGRLGYSVHVRVDDDGLDLVTTPRTRPRRRRRARAHA